MIFVTQQFEFSAAHRLHCPQWSDEENARVFGKCNFANGHGHNYVVEVTIGGEPNATGEVLPLRKIEQTVDELVINRFDHRHLNYDTAEFAELNPTVENLAQVVWNLLDGKFAPARLSAVRVYETPKTWAECRGAEAP
jgi:6-pyruvoyltetrahydropterin/6-carboxytetrahydropterin synthase